MFWADWPYDYRARVPSFAHGLQILVHTNVIIAAAAAGVAVTTFVILREPIQPSLVIFAFAAAFLAYTLNRIWDHSVDTVNLPKRAALIDHYRSELIVFGFMVYAIGTMWIAQTSPRLAPFVIIPPIAAWVYSQTSVRERLLVKNVFAGVCWAGIPIGIGATVGGLTASVTWITAIAIAWLITTAAIIFDIKDILGDRGAGVHTFPIAYGVARTRQFAIVSLLLLVPIIGLGALFVDPRLVLLLLYVGYLVVTIPFASETRDTLYYGLVIDGEHIFVAIVALSWVRLG